MKSQTLSARNSRPMFVLFVSVVFLYWMALYLYVPTLPVYAQAKTDNLALVGVVLSMYGLWQAVIRTPLGIAADWLGWRKPFIVVGLLLTGLGAWVMGVSHSINGLILGRAITGLAAGTWVPLVVVFSSFFADSQAIKAASILTLVGSVSRLLATSLTGSLNDLGGYPLAFFLAAGVSALAVLLLMPVHEPRRPPQTPSLKSIGRLATRRDVLVPTLLSTVAQYVTWASTFGFLPILAKNLGATNVIQSALVAVNLAVLTLGNLAATPLVNRLGKRAAINLSFAVMAIGIAAAALTPSLGWVFFAQVCIGLANGVNYPMLMGMSIEYVGDRERSTAMGLHQSIYGIGMFAGPWLSGLLADAIGIQSMFGVTAVVSLALGLLGVRWVSIEKSRSR